VTNEDPAKERAMRIIIICAASELVFLAGAMLAGAPVLAAARAGASRAANATVLLAIALASWVLAGLVVNGVVARLPGEGRSAAGFLSIGNLDFNLAVFTPMIAVAAALVYRLAFGLVVAARGGGLRDCIRASLRSAPRSNRRAV
jgi:hypothetical protein